MDPAQLTRLLVDTAARRYRAADRFAYYFARGKLGGDPVFEALLARGLLPLQARILDLGCGQGLFAAWLEAAIACRHSGEWCDAWPEPPTGWQYRGIELMPREVARAHAALGVNSRVEAGDIREVNFGAADVVAIFDVLHYVSAPEQEAVLRRVRGALSPGGMLLLRIGHAGGGLRFRFSNWIDRMVLLLRGCGWTPLHCRPLPDWLELLAGLGFRTESIPMSARTLFANVLLVARPQ